jgi:hypothetical protein
MPFRRIFPFHTVAEQNFLSAIQPAGRVKSDNPSYKWGFNLPMWVQSNFDSKIGWGLPAL